MLNDLDETLESLIYAWINSRGEIKSVPDYSLDGSPDICSVVFVPKPQALVLGTGPLAISLFLYDIQENVGLREVAWSTEKKISGGRVEAVRKAPVARVNCAYLISVWINRENTIWKSFTESECCTVEHRVLGTLMSLLLRNRTLPSDCLKGRLASSEVPVRIASLSPSEQFRGLGEYWQAIGDGAGVSELKAVLHCTVTVPVALSVMDQEKSSPLVGVYQP